MKKIIALIVCAVMICTFAIGVCAADVRPTEVIAESGKHLVIKTGTAEMFSWDGLFQAGLQYGSIENGTLKLPKSDDRKVISVYYDQGTTVKNEGEAHWDDSYSIDTKAYKYFTVTYKSAGKFTLHWMFSYNTADGSEFDANGMNPDFVLPASADWTTAIIAIPADKVSKDIGVSKVTRLDLLSAEADAYVKDIGFFATEAGAKAYYGIGGGEVNPLAPDTADYAAAAVVIAAVSAAAVLAAKKKR